MGQCKGIIPQQNQMYQGKQFDYELINSFNTQETINRYKLIISFGINYKNTLMATGSDQQIIVYQFKDGRIKQLQILLNHKCYITTLNFFKGNQIFISGSRDSYFILWSINQVSNGKYFCKVKAHIADINCIALSESNENLIISCSDDCTIMIWKSFSNSFSQLQCTQKITEHSNHVFGLSINNCGTQFLSYAKDGLILVMEKNNSQNWILKQKIQTLGYGYRINYLTNSIFSFQPRIPEPHNILYIYQLDTKIDQFVQVQQLSVEGGDQGCNTYFHMYYNPLQCVLINKNGFYLNIISFDEEQELNYQFNVKKAINFNIETLYGTFELKWLISNYMGYKISLNLNKKIYLQKMIKIFQIILSMIKHLLQLGVNINKKVDNNFTLLLFSIKSNQIYIVINIIQKNILQYVKDLLVYSVVCIQLFVYVK
ncbi:unnamed protein product [Paramecium sonneborni]|uniref:Uncharacterized protein n=1 Tax=Paramecium sonneborni TaxID=65129 RepID=A0A8S1MQD1_9CILI|nr:unnamed protein product [Paramecium sonneborni]